MEWWETLEAKEAARKEAEGIEPLFDLPNMSHPDIKQVEAEALPVIAENIARVAEKRGQFKVGDFPVTVFGDYLGMVRETVVRAAIKELHKNGWTPSDGKGKRITDLIVTRPPQEKKLQASRPTSLRRVPGRAPSASGRPTA